MLRAQWIIFALVANENSWLTALNIKYWSVWHDVVYGWRTGLALCRHWWFIAFGISLNSWFWAFVCCLLFCFLFVIFKHHRIHRSQRACFLFLLLLFFFFFFFFFVCVCVCVVVAFFPHTWNIKAVVFSRSLVEFSSMKYWSSCSSEGLSSLSTIVYWETISVIILSLNHWS